MGFFNRLQDAFSNLNRMQEFYNFIKEVHEQGVCLTSTSCDVLNFLIPLPEVLFNEKKGFNEVREFFIRHCVKKEKKEFFFHVFLL